MANPKKIKATPKQTSILFLISLCSSLIIRIVFTYTRFLFSLNYKITKNIDNQWWRVKIDTALFLYLM